MSMSDEQMRRVTGQVMSDKTVHPLHIAPQMAWPLAVIIRLAARHPARNKWGKKEHISIAKKLEKPVKARHPLPDFYGVNDLMPIMEDAQEMQIALTMRDLWMIVGAVQLVTRHPEANGEALRLATETARLMQARIIEHHPDAWLLLQMGWDERYDQ